MSKPLRTWLIRNIGLTAVALLFCGGSAKLDELRHIPREERASYVESLRPPPPVENAADQYRAAETVYKDHSDYAVGRTHEEIDAHYFIAGNLPELSLRSAWSDEQERVLDRWLSDNAKTLDAIRKACELERAQWPIVLVASAASDLTETDTGSYEIYLAIRNFAKLVAIKARASANAGEWDDALEWNLCIYRLANHIFQYPENMADLIGYSIESIAVDQTLTFIEEHEKTFSWRTWERINERKHLRSADDVANAAESLSTLNVIESCYAWANGRNEEEPFFLESIVGQDQLGLAVDSPSLFGWAGPPRFRTAKEFRNLLKSSSVDQEWRHYKEACAAYQKWYDRPFHQAWKDRKELSAEYAAKLQHAPALHAMLCSGLSPPPYLWRYLSNRALARRNALATVLLLHDYHREHGRFPKSLRAIKAPNSKHVIDPFSGNPLVYRRSTKKDGFVLYSVSKNQRDDGGRDESGSMREEGDRKFWPPSRPELDE